VIRSGGKARAAAALVPVALLATACGSTGGADGSTKATGRWGQVYDHLCAAATAATKGDASGAKADFDDIHAALHELAAAVEREDRGAAARLLEAKQRVEAERSEPHAVDLEALADRVGDGIRATGGSAPRTCP
jgi:hypothetical protein